MVLMLSAIDTADRLALLRVQLPYAVTFEGLTSITELILDSPRQIPDALARPPSVIPTRWRREAARIEFIPILSFEFHISCSLSTSASPEIFPREFTDFNRTKVYSFHFTEDMVYARRWKLGK